jgi:hypothetical protein
VKSWAAPSAALRCRSTPPGASGPWATASPGCSTRWSFPGPSPLSTWPPGAGPPTPGSAGLSSWRNLYRRGRLPGTACAGGQTQGPRPRETSISPALSLPIACNQAIFQAPPPPGASPDNGRTRPLSLQVIPQATSPRNTPLSGERSPLTKALAGGLHSFRSPRRPGYRLGYPVKPQQAASPALTAPRPVKASRG